MQPNLCFVTGIVLVKGSQWLVRLKRKETHNSREHVLHWRGDFFKQDFHSFCVTFDIANHVKNLRLNPELRAMIYLLGRVQHSPQERVG